MFFVVPKTLYNGYERSSVNGTYFSLNLILYNDERRGDRQLYAVFSHIDIFSQKLIMQGESISNLLGDEMNALN